MAKRGRPKKEISDLEKHFPKWKETILELYENGASDVQVRAWFIKQNYNLQHDIWYKWIDKEQSFAETIKKGHILSEAWWQDQGQKIRSGLINTALWQINMTNRFNWRYGKEPDKFEGNTQDQLSTIADEIGKFDTNSNKTV